MIRAITNLKDWQKVLINVPYCDVFYTPGYASAFANAGVNPEFYESFSGEPMLIYYEDEGGKIINPVFKREIPGTELYDIISPYGYSGPLRFGKPFLPNYLADIHSFCLENHIVSEFARMHPFFHNILPGAIKKSEVVWVNLEDKNDCIKRGFSKNCRNAIANAKRSGMVIEVIERPGYDNMVLFEKLYTKTMRRNNASRKYLFSVDFLNKLAIMLSGNILMVNAEYEKQIISSAIFLHYGDFIHYYLAGSDDQFKLNANNLILEEAIAWAKQGGFKKMNLGGGYKENDSLSKFKQGFSHLTEDFCTYQKVHMQQHYDTLSKGKKTDFFPAYRGE